MTALARAELLKLRTTRVPIALALATLVLVALIVVATLATADEAIVFDEQWRRDLVSTGGLASLVAFLLGILIATTEYRHGTITPTFLVTPVRRRVLAAKLAAGPLAGIPLALVASALTLAIAVPWLAARDAGIDLGDDVPARLGEIFVATTLWSVLGVAIGALVRHQVAAIIGTLAWFIVVEPLVSLASSTVGDYLPGRAVEAVGGSVGDDVLGYWRAVLLMLAYLAVLVVAAVVVTERRDVS